MSCLRDAFDSVLNIKGVCPENSLLYVAMGAAFCAEHEVDLTTLPEKLQAAAAQHSFEHLPPLFKNEANILFLRSVTLRKVSLSAPLRRQAKPLSVLIPAARPLKSLL